MSLHPAVNENDHFKGNEDAKLVIVEFGDFECPHCAKAHVVTEKMMEEFGSQIKFVFRNFPLSQIHAHAIMAAQAAEAAALQGKYWEMHNSIFENQRHLQASDFINRAKEFGLNVSKFESDMQTSSILDKIEADFESGARSGVNGTPSFFINGKKFNGGADNLLELIRESTE